MGLPLGHLGGGLLKHPFPDVNNHAGGFGNVNELHRADQAALGMVPAQQRLRFFNRARAEVNDRLVNHFKLLLGQCAAQVSGHSQPELGRLFERGGKEAKAVASRALGYVQGLICMFKKIFNAVGILRVQGDAQTGRHKHLLGADTKGLGHLVQHLLQGGFQHGVVGHARNHQSKFIAAHTRHRVHAAQTAFNAPRSLHQKHVAGLMAQRVVDLLEVVQVYKNDTHRGGVQLVAQQGFFQPGAQHAPVGQAGQRIKVGLLPDLCLCGLALRNVGVGTDHAQGATGIVPGNHDAPCEYPFPSTVFAQNAVFIAVDRGLSAEVVFPVALHLQNVVQVRAAIQ